MSCNGGSECADRDLTGKRVAWLLWCGPALLMVVGIFLPAARAWLWVPSLTVMGTACLANAARCGRLHCHLTGPLFLVGAALTALSELGLMRLDWRWFLSGLALLTALAYGLEYVRGKYVRAAPAIESSNP